MRAKLLAVYRRQLLTNSTSAFILGKDLVWARRMPFTRVSLCDRLQSGTAHARLMCRAFAQTALYGLSPMLREQHIVS